VVNKPRQVRLFRRSLLGRRSGEQLKQMCSKEHKHPEVVGGRRTPAVLWRHQNWIADFFWYLTTWVSH